MEDEGFVIKKKEYSDYDIFGSFYTNNLGKINLLIKNARKSKKRFMGKLEPFNLVSLKFKYKNQGSYPNLIESIDLIDNHNYITLDKKIIVLSSLINEYIDNFETLENASKKNFNYLKDFFLRKDKNNLSLCLNEVIKFQLKYLKNLGVSPSVQRCFKCQKNLKEINFFDIQNGGNICYSCGKNNANFNSMRIKNKIDLRSVKRDDNSKLNLIKTIINFSEFHSGKQFNSVQYLD